MQFIEFAKYLAKLDGTTSRNEMTEILSELLEKLDPSETRVAIYLLEGRIVPLYDPLKFNFAEKMMIRALAATYEKAEKEVRQVVRSAGDTGSGAFVLSEGILTKDGLSVGEVHKRMVEIAEVEGEGSVERKIELVGLLLSSLEGEGVRYVVRIILSKMRLGFSAMTVLDSLSWMVAGDKSERKNIERGYHVRPDLGLIGEVVKKEGVEAVSKLKPEVFTPILMARAERMSDSQEIIDKIGRCAVEAKIDGFRVQVHKKGDEVRLFTRSLEDVTYMYPDVEHSVKNEVNGDAILEGEAIAFDPETGRYREFQATSQRKRKYGIEEMAKKIPLRLIAFELLWADGDSYIDEAYEVRHAKLVEIVKDQDNGGVVVSQVQIAETPDDIDSAFEEAAREKYEGIMAKRLEGVYQAGARGWNWIKYKASYSGSLDDTIDAVVMGYYYGRGKRNEFGIGAFLIGVYDSDQDKFVTIAKVGTGLTDSEWKQLKKRADNARSAEKAPLYKVDSQLECDVWVDPEIVVEVRADEITRSAVHTAGRTRKASKSGKAKIVDESGFALRFPRLERFRDDRKVDDITTLSEIRKMFDKQGS